MSDLQRWIRTEHVPTDLSKHIDTRIMEQPLRSYSGRIRAEQPRRKDREVTMSSLERRSFLRRALGAAGWGLAVPLFAACQPAAPAPTPTTAAKPTEPPKPAAPTAPPSASGGSPVAKPAASPSPSPSPAAAAPKPAAPQAAPAAAGKVTKVIYGIVSINPNHLVALVARERPEFMQKHGVDLDVTITQSSPAAAQALVGGSLHLTSTTQEASWTLQDRTPDVMQVFAVNDGAPYSLIVNPTIKKHEDLRGKPVGVTAIRGGADTTALLLMMLEKGLRDQADYSLVVVGTTASKPVAMKAGTVMAVSQIEPQTSVMKDDGFVELDYGDNYPIMKNTQSIVGIGKKSWYESNMDAAVGFVKGWIDVLKWLYDARNKDQAIELIAKIMNVQPKYATTTYEGYVVRSKTLAQDLKIDLRKMGQMAENQKRIGLENVPTGDFGRYIDNRLVERALA